MKKICTQLIQKLGKIGLRVHAVSSDMGSDNRALWKCFGIRGKRNGEIHSSILHPARPENKLCFLADVPHLFKRIRLMLLTHKNIYLDLPIVRVQFINEQSEHNSH